METRVKHLVGNWASGLGSWSSSYERRPARSRKGWRALDGGRRAPRPELMLAALLFLTLTTGVASANAAKGGQAPETTVRPSPNGSQRLELLRAEIEPPKGRPDGESKDRLKHMIEQVRSIRFQSDEQGGDISASREALPASEPNQPLLAAQLPDIERVDQVTKEQPHGGVTDRTLEILRGLLQHPDKLRDPLDIGEILFSSGNTKDAVPFYREALKRADPNDVSLLRDRAWIMLQTGNCLWDDDPAAAARVYKQLLVEQPNSAWAELAQAQIELIAWRLKENPDELISEPPHVDSPQSSGLSPQNRR
jgi:tetratricopeptide (TPR) repeat protein